MRLDPLDATILRLLREDARLSYRDVAQRAGSTVPTVSARVKALEDLGVIRGYHADVDLSLMGGSLVSALVEATPRDARAVADRLASMPGVEDVMLLSGARIAARVRLRPPELTLQQLHDALAALDGVVRYDVRDVLATPAAPHAADVPEEVDVACHQCGGPIHGAPVRRAFAGRAHVFCCRQCLADFADRYARVAARSASDGKKNPRRAR